MNFWDGAVKLTFNSNRNGAGVSFNQLTSGPWEFILLSSYCTDYEWLLNQFDGIAPGIDINLIEDYDRKNEHAGVQSIHVNKHQYCSLEYERALNLIHPVFPNFPNYGVMHCKLMVLAAKDFLRIVVSSANLTDYDYSKVQNIVFVQDLPKLMETSLTASTASFLMDSQFYTSLLKLLEKLGVFNEKKLIMPMDLLQKYDWHPVKAKLVVSVPIYAPVSSDHCGGLLMLNRIVNESFAGCSDDEISLEYQGSSIGSLNREWLNKFVLAAAGKLFSKPKGGVKRKAPPSKDEPIVISSSDDENDDHAAPLKIVFPTKKTVIQSAVGPDGFGTLFCRKRDFEAASFPRDCFHDCTTVASSPTDQCAYAMHSKIMTITNSQNGDPNSGYVYCGSHNFTPSAWGKFAKADSMLMINNWELGVIFPKSLFSFEYPYTRPPPKYSELDQPWDQFGFFSINGR